jgi:5'-3' exonuclease
MGIPRFFAWLKNQDYPDVLQNTLPSLVDWLIFDTNSLFHQAHQTTYAYGEGFNVSRALYVRKTDPEKLEREFRETFITLMMNAVTAIKPLKGILIAVDGVAPQAKIQQQRQRRYKGPRTSEAEEEIDPELAALRKPIVDPNRITPGTEFMFRLDDFLRKWLKDPKNGLQLGVEKVIYSSHLVPGEGEHKYLELLRSGEIPSTGIHVIHGMDADLFILSLVAPVERIYITRDDIDQVVNIQAFRHTLYRLMKHETTPADFAVLTFFIGNDFLPHQPSLLDMKRSIDALLAAYTKVGKPLTKKTSEGHVLIWSNLEEFLKVMSEIEGSLLGDEAIRGFKYPSPSFEKALKMQAGQREMRSIEEKSRDLRSRHIAERKFTFYFDTFRQLWYEEALGPRGDTSILEFLMQSPVYAVTEERIQEQVISYLRGLAWNLAYYMDGWNKTSLEYIYPYHQTPLFRDLAEAITRLRIEEGNTLEVGIFRGPDEVYEFNPVHQLLAVLPFESAPLVPEEVRALMNIESPIYDMYPNQFQIDRSGTNRKWEGLALIPFAESERIIAAVADVPFPKTRWRKYQAGENYVVTFQQEQVDLIRRQRDQMQKIQSMFPGRRQETQRREEVSREREARGARGTFRGTGTSRGEGRGTSRGTRGGERGARGSFRGRGVPRDESSRGTRGRGESSRGTTRKEEIPTSTSVPTSRPQPTSTKPAWQSSRFL